VSTTLTTSLQSPPHIALAPMLEKVTGGPQRLAPQASQRKRGKISQNDPSDIVSNIPSAFLASSVNDIDLALTR